MEKNKTVTLQEPIDAGFDGASTAADVIEGIDLSGKVAIVTGGYAGIGLETTSVLSGAGATVIVPARDIEKATRALKGIERVQIAPLDLADPASIDAFADKFLASEQPLHIMVNNAGVMANPFTLDKRGYESQFATNHLGHFQLVVRLWPALRRANGARVVALSSWGHRFSPVVFEDLHFQQREYDRWLAYGQSKTANALFAVELDRRGREEGIRAFAVHPGSIVDTDLKRYMSEEELQKAGVFDQDGKPILDPSKQLKTIEQGAATSVWCAVSPQLNGMGGVYCENCDISPVTTEDKTQGGNDISKRAPSKAFGVFPYAIDPVAAKRLWELSELLLNN
ncbi:oxidoreductase [Chitinophaga sp. CF418]|uniref:oxidoreductase n=1 Tax=Chitinophaga sp. CF418 TaxID=1855287 RepID=UPI0009192189|nr:oxidoreductase [Chitinophaga sp. CF418]SHN18467.1 NAD(P)-dependent dehydrogenase, short-chain alcohol dehydrogenase family [Chitinophaga sp. CF418]